MRHIIVFLGILFLMSCSKSNEKTNTDKQLSQKNVVRVEGATTIRINDTASLTVYWPYSSGCDVLEKFEETRQGNIVSIKAMGYVAEGICTMDAGIKTKIYQFKSAVAGDYELRFLNRDNSFISYRITVN